MQALYLADGRLRLDEAFPRPEPAPGEALVKVRLAGICATDLEMVKGYAGFTGIPGHEFVGEVMDVANKSDLGWLRRRVVGSINIGCGTCAVCQGEGPAHCPTRAVLGIINKNGAFAEYLTLPVANLIEVPEAIPDEMAVFTEPLAAALRIRAQTIVKPGMLTAVLGPGRLGLLIAQVLALAGTRVTVLGRRAGSLELPAQLGLETGIAAEYEENTFDFVVEATGNEAGLAQSLRLIKPRGTMVLKSTFHGSPTLDLTKLVVAEINVIGSRCGPFLPALRMLARHEVKVTPLIDAEYSLGEGLPAFTYAAQPGIRKVLLRP